MPKQPSEGSPRLNMPPQTDMPPTRESIKQFVGRNIVEASYAKLVCGDGRFTSGQSAGGLHMFGGDMGALAAFWKVGKTHFKSIEDCVEKYQTAKARALQFFNVPETEARRLYLHTDGHGDERNGVYGCGHMANISSGKYSGRELYDTDDADMRALFQYVTTSGKVDHELTPLGGNHAEKTVIYVHGPKGNEADTRYTLNSQDDETKEMHFVVDIERVKDYFKRIASAMPIEGVSGEALFAAYSKQELTTARVLASGYQIVDVYITDKDNFEIDFDETKKVPSKPDSVA